jgi:hypothetical protein
LGVAAFTLAFLSLVPAIRAAETPEVDRNSNAAGEPFSLDAGVSLRSPFQSSENFSLGAVAQSPVQYVPVHPRISGQEWNVQVQITPVMPKLIKGVLFQ